MLIRCIVCPTDFSTAAQHALEYAIGLASPLNAELKVVHVYQVPSLALPDGAILATPELLVQIQTELQRQMDALLTQVKSRMERASGTILQGTLHEEIRKFAVDEKADLIVMGTHGRTGLKHLLLGSVAERVVRTSDVPVLTVRSPEAAQKK